MPEARGYALRYTSARRLRADHDAYLTHGGMLVPMPRGTAPALNVQVELRIEAPGGRAFSLPARAGNLIPGQGLMLSFEPGARGALAALATLVDSPAFAARCEAEEEPTPPPQLQTIDLGPDEDEATDPGLPAPDLSAPAARRRRPIPAEPTDPGAGVAGRSSRRPRPTAAPPPPVLELVDTSATAEEDILDLPTHASDDLGLAVDALATLSGDPSEVASEDSDDLGLDLDGPGEDTPDADEAAEDFGDDDRVYGEGEVRPPRPGERYTVLVVKFTSVSVFQPLAEAFEASAVFTVPVDDEGTAPVGSVAQLRLALPGYNVFEMWARVEQVGPGGITVRVDPEDGAFRKAVLYPTTPPAQKRIEREAHLPHEAPTCLKITQERPKEDLDRLPVRRRLARMGMDDKINLALSGNREERMALAMDGNKAIHHYLLKNAKLTLDEVGFMARLPSLNPDVLDKIAESPAYTQNPTITKALVYNPKTPVKTAIRLLDRLPRSEVMNLAKRTTMNARLVMAAKKKLERKTR